MSKLENALLASGRPQDGLRALLTEEQIKVLFSKIGDPTSEECHPWIGYVAEHGYGYVRIGGRGGPAVLAHRAVYELKVGQIPPGLTLDHLCRNRSCVNPDHLEPVTNRENILRGNGASARNVRKTHCTKGHEYSEENTAIYGGKRVCKQCNRDRFKRNYYLSKA